MNKKLLIIICISGLLLSFFVYKKVYKNAPNTQTQTARPVEAPPVNANIPNLLSTKPDPLDNIVISSVQIIQLNFSHPIENSGEFKHRLEPKGTKYKIKLSDDRKTVLISPEEHSSYPVGTEFTLFISPETKFDKGLRMDHEIILHFKTIDYKGA